MTVWQVWDGDTCSWHDVTPEYYAERLPSNRRILYTAIPAPSAVKCVTGEYADCGNDFGCAGCVEPSSAQPPIDSAKVEDTGEPVAWITKDQLNTLTDLTSDAWVYWRESGHVAEDDEIALYLASPASPAASVLSDAARDVLAERKRQDVLWGGPDHDDQQSNRDWTHYMGKQAAKIAPDPERARERYIKIAALAVAAIESIDRAASESQRSGDGS